MRTHDTVAALARFERRGPGTDAERRAARWLARALQAAGREVRVEPFWCRPNWAMAHAWHAALALAGSLGSVGSPRVGGAALVVALVSVVCDEVFGYSLGRRLTPERASQNLIATPHRAQATAAEPIRLIITANYDAGRAGLVYRAPLRRVTARLHRMTGGRAPGWLGWLVVALVWLVVVAILRLGGDRGSVIGAVQLPPTVALVLALALLIELASAPFGPAAGDNASGAAVAAALARALDAAPPRHLVAELVLTGAGEGGGLGLRSYLRARRRALRAHNTVVLGIAACGAGTPRWWISDGPLVPLRYFNRLRQLAGRTAREDPGLEAAPHRGRGATPALPARARQLPAMAIGSLERDGLVPRSHQSTDTVDAIDQAALDRCLELALMLTDEIEAFIARRRAPAGAGLTPA